MNYTPTRKPKYISYTSLHLWETEPEEFFLKYLADAEPEPWSQEEYAAAGSGFDAYVKSSIARDLVDNGTWDCVPDDLFLESLLETQVEDPHRVFGQHAGQHLFEVYQRSGAYDALMLWVLLARDVRMEYRVQGEIGGVPLSGRPDLSFSIGGVDFLLDWKVKGYCSVHGASPTKHFVWCYNDPLGKPAENAAHPGHKPVYLEVAGRPLEISEDAFQIARPKYADQLSIYGWSLGLAQPVCWVDELICRPWNDKSRPADPPGVNIRVATHRGICSDTHLENLRARIEGCWEAIQTGHVFSEMSRENNDLRCNSLEGVAAGLKRTGEEHEDWFRDQAKAPFKG